MSDEVKRVVHTLVHDFSRYRNIEIQGPPDDLKITKDMETLGYLRIDAVRKKPRGERSVVIILVLDETKKYSHNSPELKKLLHSVDSEDATRNNTLDEVLLIANTVFENKKNLLDVVKLYQTREVKGPDPTGKSTFYTLMYYRNLKRCIPEHVGVPKHVLMTAQETQDFCARQYKTIKDF